MSDELKVAQQQVVNLTNQCKGLDAQLAATKGMLNDQLASMMQIRANLHIFQLANQEHLQNEANLNAVIKALTKEKEDLLAKVTELDAKLNPSTAITDDLVGDINATDKIPE